jgi:hypothetical protein
MRVKDSETQLDGTHANELLHKGVIIPPGAIMLCEDARAIALLLTKEGASDLVDELGRLRSQTYASIGLKSLYGLDIYDEYYKHIVLLDKESGAIIGGMRVGLGDEILARYGVHGFYLTKYWHFSDQMMEIARQSIDVGRLWLLPAYQKQRGGMLLLWRALVTFLNSVHHSFFLGFVGLADSAQSSREILMNYLWHYYRMDPPLVLSQYPVPLKSYDLYSREHANVAVPQAYRELIAELQKNDPDYPFPLHVRYLARYDIKLAGEFSKESLDNEILCLFLWTKEGSQSMVRYYKVS